MNIIRSVFSWSPLFDTSCVLGTLLLPFKDMKDILAQGLVFITFYMPRITLFIGKYAFPLTKLSFHVHEWDKKMTIVVAKKSKVDKKRARRSNESNALKIKIFYSFHTRISLIVEQCTSRGTK